MPPKLEKSSDDDDPANRISRTRPSRPVKRSRPPNANTAKETTSAPKPPTIDTSSDEDADHHRISPRTRPSRAVNRSRHSFASRRKKDETSVEKMEPSKKFGQPSQPDVNLPPTVHNRPWNCRKTTTSRNDGVSSRTSPNSILQENVPSAAHPIPQNRNLPQQPSPFTQQVTVDPCRPSAAKRNSLIAILTAEREPYQKTDKKGLVKKHVEDKKDDTGTETRKKLNSKDNERKNSGKDLPHGSQHVSDDSSSDESEDGQLDPEIISEAEAFVKAIYRPLLVKHEELKRNEHKAFSEHLEKYKNKKSEYRLPSGEKPVPLALWKEETISDIDENKLYIKTTPSQPKTKFWIPIETNIKGEESYRLSHMPYISETYDHRQLLEDVLVAYPEGVHGTEKGWGKYISEYLLYLLLKEATPKWIDTGRQLKYLYQAIFSLFPNKLTPKQLETAYPSLERRFDSTAPQPDFVKNTPAEAIRRLNCFKCRQYNCLLHNSEESFRMQQPTEKTTTCRRPCSQDCYMFMPEVELNIPSDEAPIKKKAGLVVKERPFAEENKAMFLKLVKLSRFDPCRIRSMITLFEQRSCQEIYVLMKKIPIPDRERNPDDSTVRKKNFSQSYKSCRDYVKKNCKVALNVMELYRCDHDGICSKDNKDCICAEGNKICNKYCRCRIDCAIRWPGCQCEQGKCRNDQCPCFRAGWECDSSLCTTCNSGPVANLTNRSVVPLPAVFESVKVDGDDEIDWFEQENIKLDSEPAPVCCNVSLQRCHRKKLKVAKSNIAGFGCFIEETAEKDELIAEYVGEVISHDETERRGLIYDAQKCSYTFSLSENYAIDATRMGNPTRYANHSDVDSNCYSRVVTVDCDQRIGLCASRRIEAGEELLFDYKYDKSYLKKFCPITKKVNGKNDKQVGSSKSRQEPSKKK